MKTNMRSKTVVISFFIFSVCQARINAQTNTFPATGKVGIGTTVPASQLEILTPATVGESLMKFRVSDAPNDYMEIRNVTNGAGIFMPGIKGNVTSMNSTALYLLGETNSTNDTGITPAMVFDSRLTAGKINNRPLFGWESYGTSYMAMLANGNLGIGINSPAEKLSVNGNIRAKEIKVETANWPDYVFSKDYQLLSLQETEEHIKEKGYLPGIPSAQEVKSNGIDLGEMNVKLLKKIEELTLHLIQQEKKNNAQTQTIQRLEKRLVNLETKR